jgi:hypothetical protein
MSTGASDAIDAKSPVVAILAGDRARDRRPVGEPTRD